VLKPFRRHSAECLYGPGGTPETPVKPGLLTDPKLTPAKIRVYPKCDCACWFSGTTPDGRVFPRTALHVTDWKTAERMVAERNLTREQQFAKITLAEAQTRWYRTCELAKRSKSTLKQHRRIGAQLLEVVDPGSTAKLLANPDWTSKVNLAAIDSEVIAELRMVWVKSEVEDITHRTYLAYLNGFFRHAVRQQWIAKNPVPPSNEWPPRTAIDREETMPMDIDGSDTNYRKFLAALVVPRPRGNRGRKIAILSGARLVALTELMYEAGLRISDAVFFQPAKLVFDQECASYTFLPYKTRRTGKLCTTFLPLWLARKLRELAPLSPLSPGQPLFDGRDLEKIEASVRREYISTGKACGIPNVHPHRFRDSFAVNRLSADPPMTMDNVSKLLGHASVAMTERYYAPWVPARQDQLRRAYLKTHQPPTTPPGVIPFPKAANE
jgi:integrase